MDDRVRAAEREAAAAGTVEAQADVLRQRLRCGSLTRKNLDLLVWAGYEPAWVVQDNWIHSDHIPGICPCPGCWKGGGELLWVLELHRRWGHDVSKIAFDAIAATLKRCTLPDNHSDAYFNQMWDMQKDVLWRVIFDTQNANNSLYYEAHRQFRDKIEQALVEYALNA